MRLDHRGIAFDCAIEAANRGVILAGLAIEQAEFVMDFGAGRNDRGRRRNLCGAARYSREQRTSRHKRSASLAWQLPFRSWDERQKRNRPIAGRSQPTRASRSAPSLTSHRYHTTVAGHQNNAASNALTLHRILWADIQDQKQE